MREHSLQVRRTARWYSLGGAGPAVRQLWFVCHGYGQLARDFLGAFAAVESSSRLIVAPEALNRYYLDSLHAAHGPDSSVGATWMTREDRLHEIEDYITYLDTLHAAVLADLPEGADPEVTALGFSQGVATVSRWASRTRRRIDRVVLWAAMLPPDAAPAEGVFGGAPLIRVFGDRDTSVAESRIEAESELLDRAGIPHRLIRFEGGHHLNSVVLRQLADETA